MAKGKSFRGFDPTYGASPINGAAARVTRRSKKKPIPAPEKLRQKALDATSKEKRDALLAEAEKAERRLKVEKTRLTGRGAEERARKAMEAAKWRRGG